MSAPPRAEPVLRAVVLAVFAVGLVGLSAALHEAVHPVAGWLVPFLVGGGLSLWFGARWLDERTVARDRERLAPPRGEALSIPAGFDPDR